MKTMTFEQFTATMPKNAKRIEMCLAGNNAVCFRVKGTLVGTYYTALGLGYVVNKDHSHSQVCGVPTGTGLFNYKV